HRARGEARPLARGAERVERAPRERGLWPVPLRGLAERGQQQERQADEDEPDRPVPEREEEDREQERRGGQPEERRGRRDPEPARLDGGEVHGRRSGLLGRQRLDDGGAGVPHGGAASGAGAAALRKARATARAG